MKRSSLAIIKIPIFHAKTRPAWGAVEASLRAAALAAQAGDAPLYLVHMNTAGEVDQLAYAREHMPQHDGRNLSPISFLRGRRFAARGWCQMDLLTPHAYRSR
jgi:hypothetical protein